MERLDGGVEQLPQESGCLEASNHHTPLPASLEERVRAADSDQLDEWSERILEARALLDVFGADWQH